MNKERAGKAVRIALTTALIFPGGGGIVRGQDDQPTPTIPETISTPSPEAPDTSQWTKIEVTSIEDMQQDNWQMASWGSEPPRAPRDGVVNEVLASQYQPTDIILDSSGTQFFPEEVDLDDLDHALADGRNVVFPYKTSLGAEGFGTVYIQKIEGNDVNLEIYTEGLPARFKLIPSELMTGSSVDGYYLQIDGSGNASRLARRLDFKSIDNTPIPRTNRVGEEFELRGNRRDFLVHINVSQTPTD